MSLLSDYASYDALGLAALVARGSVHPQDLLDAAMAQVEAHNGTLNAVPITM